MWAYDPLCFDERFVQLETSWIRPRTERSRLVMTGRATAPRLKQLDEEEAQAFSAMMDYRMRRSGN